MFTTSPMDSIIPISLILSVLSFSYFSFVNIWLILQPRVLPGTASGGSGLSLTSVLLLRGSRCD